jgi:hypothetical protein
VDTLRSSRARNLLQAEREALEDWGKHLGGDIALKDEFEVEALILIHPEELKQLRESPVRRLNRRDWLYEELFRRYPGTPGLLALSPVGFSSDSTLAYFESMVLHGFLNCSGGSVWMKKGPEGWRTSDSEYQLAFRC